MNWANTNNVADTQTDDGEMIPMCQAAFKCDTQDMKYAF